MSSLTLESAPSPDLLIEVELVSLLEEAKRRKDRRRLTEYRPYAKQREFHARALSTANAC
jgi:hypothetical protein